MSIAVSVLQKRSSL